MVLVQKRLFFITFFFRQNSPGKCLWRYFTTKKLLSRLKKTKISKSRKIDIFPKALTHGFSFTFFFLRNLGKENVFDDIQERKISFLGYKNKKLKNSKNLQFYKGVNSWFLSKNDDYSKLIFLGNISKETVFYDILEWKNFFLGYKNKKFKNWKHWHFSKGINPWFWSKNGYFS